MDGTDYRRSADAVCRSACTGRPAKWRALRIPGWHDPLRIRLCLIPCVNPDGVEILIFGPQRAGDYAYFVREHADGDTASWQANARGVDLNHNFNADWGCTAPT